MPIERLPVAGEVSEREDLLNGAVRVALEGRAGVLTLSAAFGWRRGRDGATALEPGECYLSLEDRSGGELHAAAEVGSVSVDPDTGEARVRARFVAEEVSGALAEAGPRLALECTIGVAEWSGELRSG